MAKERIPTRLDLQLEKIYERWPGRQLYQLRYWLLGVALLLLCWAGWSWWLK